VSYNQKHNEANGENNRDGANDNNSWNCGAEGPTDNREIIELRERQKRNFLATLLLSQGVPMLLAGDEFSHSQMGNNNCYSQDNELSWLNWEMIPAKQTMFDFVRRLIKIRREEPTLQRRRFFHGQPIFGSNVKDIYWLDNHFKEMTSEAWQAGFVKALGVVLIGNEGERDERGQPIVGDNLMLLLNAFWEPIEFNFPRIESIVDNFERLLDTADPTSQTILIDVTQKYVMQARSTALFRWTLAHQQSKPK
jgi:glycogen operon protein